MLSLIRASPRANGSGMSSSRRVSTLVNGKSVSGSVAPGYERVKEAFISKFETENALHGAAISAYVKGKKVVDLYGGVTSVDKMAKKGKTATDQPSIDTSHVWDVNFMDPSSLASAKGMVNLCVMVLVDRGTLAYEVPVKKYWPEFKQNGKTDITVSDLIAEKSGLEIPFEQLSEKLRQDREKFVAFLARQKPNPVLVHSNGYVTAESERNQEISALFYASELIRRTDFRGRNVTSFFSDEISKPFGVYFDLSPSDFSRVDSMAKLYGALAHDAKIDGKPLLSNPDVVKKAVQHMPGPMKKIVSVGGFVKPSIEKFPNAFTGAGTTETYADMDRELGVSYIASSEDPAASRSHHNAIIESLYKSIEAGKIKYQ